MEKRVKRSYHAALRKKQADHTRTQIMSAAAAVFSRKGYPSTRMEDVAEAAAVAVPTVYKVFRTKRALLLAAVQFVMANTASDAPIEEQPWWREQIAAADPGQQLRLIARNARAIYERAGLLLEVVRSAAAADSALAEVWDVINKERLKRAQLTAESLSTKNALKPGLTSDFAATTLLMLSAPELYTQYVAREGSTAAEYEAWLATVLSETLLADRG